MTAVCNMLHSCLTITSIQKTKVTYRSCFDLVVIGSFCWGPRFLWSHKKRFQHVMKVIAKFIKNSKIYHEKEYYPIEKNMLPQKRSMTHFFSILTLRGSFWRAFYKFIKTAFF
jgi:hypothetical protein